MSYASRSNLAAKVPRPMAITKAKLSTWPNTNEAMPGPGQKPVMPQPRPKMAEPPTSRASRAVVVMAATATKVSTATSDRMEWRAKPQTGLAHRQLIIFVGFFIGDKSGNSNFTNKSNRELT